MAASKKGISAHQLHRMLHVSYKTVTEPNPSPIGGEGKVVEADEAYHEEETAPSSARRRGRPYIKNGKAAEKRAIERVFRMPVVSAKNIREKAGTHADRKSRLHTDESNRYPAVGEEFANEFTFRYNDRQALGVSDKYHCVGAIPGADGKRLTYRGPASA